VAHNRDVKEICAKIGADRLVYQDLEDLIKAAHKGNKAIKTFDCSCFNGQYVTGDIDESYLDMIDHLRNDSAKRKHLDDNQAELNFSYSP
jgi:amidophosphoribosyltransferase